jgi:RNA polymerase primary sigma factor
MYPSALDFADEAGSLALYMQEINRYPMLSAAEEQELARKISLGRQAHDALAGAECSRSHHLLVHEGTQARRRLAQGNFFLVVSIAKRYAHGGFSLLDLIQEGNIGLMRAVDKFDVQHGTRFSTYATYWIRQSIARFIGTQRHAMRLPSHQAELLSRYYHTRARLTQHHGREPTTAEAAAALNTAPDRLDHLLRLTQTPLSLETPITDDSRPLGDTLEDQDQPPPEEQVANSLLSHEIERLLASLNSRESRVLELRFGLRDGEPRTLEAIAHRFGLTKERIRQIEGEALRKLRQPPRTRPLREYLG